MESRDSFGSARYVLITPARNEETHLGRTIESVISQTVLPIKWVIVSDGSLDRTDEIVRGYMKQVPFLELLRKEEDPTRNFGSKADAINLAYGRLRDLDFQYVGNLDADMVLDSDYYSNILSRLQENSRLGIAGGVVFSSVNGDYVTQDYGMDSVAGAVQLFRRECFEEIGGYRRLRYGGIDSCAEIMARSLGWEVRKFPDYRAIEQRRTGTVTWGISRARWWDGLQCHSLGYDPVFFALRCLHRVGDSPVIWGSVCGLSGYFFGVLRKNPMELDPRAVSFLRSEQKEKVRSVVLGRRRISSLIRWGYRRKPIQSIRTESIP